MTRVMIAAPRSGGGKTTVACALLRALQRRGLEPCAFKCGPDYIDPMFHRAVLGVESHNLDLFLCGEARLRELYTRGCAGHGAAVCEGVMGFYDGLGGTSGRASSWQVADVLDMPVVLVIPARGASLTLAAEIRGLRDFRPNSHIVGAILNECTPKLCAVLAPTLERESGVAVLGCMPTVEGARFESRHLGLKTAAELQDLDTKLDALADELEKNVDLGRLMQLCERKNAPDKQQYESSGGSKIRIGTAWDKVFSFTYGETLEVLRDFGAEIVPFSPLEDASLPENISALYLPGGYPELYAKELSANKSMLKSIGLAVQNGMPTVAECGGFLYLGASLCDGTGAEYPMTGVLPGRAADTGHLVRFGYETLCAETDSLLFRAGEQIPVHEFHHWDSTDCGGGLRVEKGERSWRCGFVSETLYAAFPHLYFWGYPELAERFVAAARRFGAKNGIM